MGFYSNVFIACTEQAYKQFENAFLSHDFAPTEIWRNSHGDYLLGWAWVKWYDEFAEMKSIQRVMQELNDNDTESTAYKFIKIDEDNSVTTEANEYGYDIFEDTYGTAEICMGTFEFESEEQILNKIAREHILAINERGNLKPKNNDEEDFLDISVWSLKAALKAAYEAGRKDGKNGQNILQR